MVQQSIEIQMPLKIDNSGGFAFVSDRFAQTAQHIESAIGTSIGERVMRGTYGTSLLTHLLGPINATTVSDMRTTIANSIATNAPEATVAGIDITPDPANASVEILVRFSVGGSLPQTLTFSLAG